ncbi:30S ribosomal protein S1 [bacterium]|nr:30S ribosomal protein S1 [bacterium]MCI0602562.1 30S ribosomal protein S1 [bacterium]
MLETPNTPGHSVKGGERRSESAKTNLEDLSNNQYEKLLQEYESKYQNLVEGQIIKGRVLKITEGEVFVDVGHKSEGIVPIREVLGTDGKVTVKPGDEISVLMEQNEEVDGYLLLSREKAERIRVWDLVESAYRDDRVLTGRVVEKVKGGLSVDIGVRAFLPGSQVDIKPIRNLDHFVNQQIRVRILKLDQKKGNIVLSRKAVVEEELDTVRKDVHESLESHRPVKGTVKNITEYGAFVDLGGIDGLIHITDMSWGRVNHPSEIFNVGDQIDVVVLNYDPENNKVSLGYKQLQPDPWHAVIEKYPVGARVKGKVINLADYGAFVELEKGVEGLIHISEMSWNEKIKHPSKILSIGNLVEAVVLSIDASNKRISLGLKQTEQNPWEVLKEKYPAGSAITGRVKNITDFGVFVEVEDGVHGLIHISDLSWSKRAKNPSEYVRKGDRISAKVLEIDPIKQRLSLGLKQMQPDIWSEFFRKYKVGDNVEGRIVNLTNYGAFVELEDGIEGLVHVSEMGMERVENPQEHFQLGDIVKAKIIKMDQGEKKIGLSIKEVQMEEERKMIESYKSSDKVTLLDLAGGELIKPLDKDN